MQIDDLLAKLDNASGDMERLRDEKDQEILILQEGMDSTIQQLSEAQQVRWHLSLAFIDVDDNYTDPGPQRGSNKRPN